MVVGSITGPTGPSLLMQHSVSPSTQRCKQLLCGNAEAGAALDSNNDATTARLDAILNFMVTCNESAEFESVSSGELM